jgi:hypothetical protein
VSNNNKYESFRLGNKSNYLIPTVSNNSNKLSELVPEQTGVVIAQHGMTYTTPNSSNLAKSDGRILIIVSHRHLEPGDYFFISNAGDGSDFKPFYLNCIIESGTLVTGNTLRQNGNNDPLVGGDKPRNQLVLDNPENYYKIVFVGFSNYERSENSTFEGPIYQLDIISSTFANKLTSQKYGNLGPI